MPVFESDSGGMRRSCVRPVPVVGSSAFKGFRFPPEVIVLAVRWYLWYGLSYRDVDELWTERGIDVDHVTVYRWVERVTPLLVDAARPCRHSVGERWCVDETSVKIAGPVALRVPGDRPVRPDHRCVRLGASRHSGRATLLRGGADYSRNTHGGGHGPGPGPFESSSMSACRARSTTPAGTPTTGSKPTMAGSTPGSNPCEASNAIGAPV